MVTNCKNCGLPIFHGIAGYAGPQCMCKLVTLPQMFDESMARIVALEAERDQLKAENEALTLRVMAGERQELAELKSAPVVMPDRRIQALAGVSLFDLGHAKGWNACLDEFESLNRSKT